MGKNPLPEVNAPDNETYSFKEGNGKPFQLTGGCGPSRKELTVGLITTQASDVSLNLVA